jgi:hypothetical protein
VSERFIKPEEVYPQLDPEYFFDYCAFTGALRHYVALTLHKTYVASDSPGDPQAKERRLLIASLYREEYTAYEDMGALVKALLDWRFGDVEFPVETILTYAPRDVVLSKVFAKRGIESPKALYDALCLADMVPEHWQDAFPSIDAHKVLLRACEFAFNDCAKSQGDLSIRSFNKLKHGLAFVQNGRRYRENLPTSPATIFRNPDKAAPNPFIIMGIPMDDENIENRLKRIEFAQSSNRILAGFYLVFRHSKELAAKKIIPPEAVFQADTLAGVREFMVQVTQKT